MPSAAGQQPHWPSSSGQSPPWGRVVTAGLPRQRPGILGDPEGDRHWFRYWFSYRLTMLSVTREGYWFE